MHRIAYAKWCIPTFRRRICSRQAADRIGVASFSMHSRGVAFCVHRRLKAAFSRGRKCLLSRSRVAWQYATISVMQRRVLNSLVESDATRASTCFDHASRVTGSWKSGKYLPAFVRRRIDIPRNVHGTRNTREVRGTNSIRPDFNGWNDNWPNNGIRDLENIPF